MNELVPQAPLHVQKKKNPPKQWTTCPAVLSVGTVICHELAARELKHAELRRPAASLDALPRIPQPAASESQPATTPSRAARPIAHALPPTPRTVQPGRAPFCHAVSNSKKLPCQRRHAQPPPRLMPSSPPSTGTDPAQVRGQVLVVVVLPPIRHRRRPRRALPAAAGEEHVELLADPARLRG